MSTQALAAVKAKFSQVIDEVTGTHERVTVTRDGNPVAVILAVEDYESLIETLEVRSHPGAVAQIRRAQAEMDSGEAYDETQARGAGGPRAVNTPRAYTVALSAAAKRAVERDPAQGGGRGRRRPSVRTARRRPAPRR